MSISIIVNGISTDCNMSALKVNREARLLTSSMSQEDNIPSCHTNTYSSLGKRSSKVHICMDLTF